MSWPQTCPNWAGHNQASQMRSAPIGAALVNKHYDQAVPGTCLFCGVMSPFPHLPGCPRGRSSRLP